MLFKLFIIVIMLTTFASLVTGLYYLFQDRGKTNRTVKALTWRIGLSLVLFLLLFLAFALGIIKPHGIIG